MDYILFGVTFCAIVLAIWVYSLKRKSDRTLHFVRTTLEKRERKLRTILENAPVVFSAIDQDGIFHISEGHGLKRLGRTNNQSIGVSIYEMHNRNPLILDAVKMALNGERVESTFTLKGVTYDLFIGPEKDERGKVIGASMLSIDVTDRKRVEDEKSQALIRENTAVATSKMKSEFVAHMSHEIRTPLNGVLGMTSLLLGTPLNAKQKEYADAIKHSGSSLLTVINDILDFSKIEAGKLDFEEIDFDMQELLRHAVKSLGVLAMQKNLKLVTQSDPQVKQWLKGDPGRFRQILNNLISNAIKFTEVGEVHVRMSLELSLLKPGCDTIRVEVQDTGVGISPLAQEKLFSAFTQADASTSRRFGGTGLGLSICKQLVEKMGGHIGVKSLEGSGSVFWFTLPFAPGSPAALPKKMDHKGLPAAFSGDSAPRILIAEDNRVNQVITVTMLQNMGCNAQVVENGLEALEALEKSAYDLVLMDYQMPKMDGLEAARNFRAQAASLNRGIPIIAMTANAMKGDKEECVAAGMDDYVSKPISYEELTSVVVRWLEIRRKRAG